MQYTLITAKGKIFTFFLEAVALTFQQAYGGIIVTGDVVEKKVLEIYS